MSQRTLLTACISACTCLVATHADADPVVVKQMLHGFIAESPLQDRTFSDSDDPDTQAHFTDGGMKVGGGTRTTLVYHQMRGSLGFGAFGIRDAHAVINAQQEVSSMTAAGGYFELAAGYELRIGPLFPYADLRATLEFDSVSLYLRHPECGNRLVPIQTHTHLGVGPSVGVFIPFEPLLFLDLSGTMGWLGERDFGAFAGFGIWVPAG